MVTHILSSLNISVTIFTKNLEKIVHLSRRHSAAVEEVGDHSAPAGVVRLLLQGGNQIEGGRVGRGLGPVLFYYFALLYIYGNVIVMYLG